MNFNVSLSLAILVFGFVTCVTPGPNNMMLLSSGVNFRFKRSIPHMLGIVIGFFIMLLIVGIGLEAIFYKFPIILKVMKVVGFLYLLYLAYGIAKSGSPKEQKSKAKPLNFIQAALFQWINPKNWVMAIGFFSNYIPLNANTYFIFLACFLFFLANIPSVVIWVLFGTKVDKWLINDKSRKIFNYTMASLLVISMIPALFE